MSPVSAEDKNDFFKDVETAAKKVCLVRVGDNCGK